MATLGLYRTEHRSVYEQAALITGEPVTIVGSDEEGWVGLSAPEKYGDLSVFWLVARILLAQRKDLLVSLLDAEERWRREALGEGNTADLIHVFWTLAEKARAVRLGLGGVE